MTLNASLRALARTSGGREWRGSLLRSGSRIRIARRHHEPDFILSDGAGKIDQDHFATIFRGLLLCQQLEVSYQSKANSKPKERVLKPYHLCCFKSQWRLIAHDSASDEIRDFVVTPRRLKAIKMLNQSFTRPKDFDAHKHLSRHRDQELVEVTVKVARAGAHHVLERNWYGLKSCQEGADGSVEAVFEVGDMGEFKRYILAFGSDCEVLSPANFRNEIRREAELVLEHAP
jgi:predicted DNA-binding transcriptional regulator YafY